LFQILEDAMAMTTRKLGSQGLEVSSIGLGCMPMSQTYGPADDGESIATLHRAVELGCNFFDTAESYGPHANEELIGRAFADRRDKVVIATKFGFRFEGGKQVGIERDSRPTSIRAAVEGSLRRLRTDHIDLLYQHRVDRAVPMEDVAGTVADLVSQGKVRFFGLSEAGVANIRRAHAVHPVSAVQSEYSLWERNLEADVIPALRQLGIGLVPFAPLGRGFLTGEVKRAEDYAEGDYRRNDPRYQGESYDANVNAAQAVHDIAARRQAKPGQVAIAWLLHKGSDIVPIPGTKRRRHLEQNLAADAVRLEPEDMATLDDALAPGKISGPRYVASIMATVDR
jgi:aryl-alcohol dehydrogenase-like predicted oxidoreductase